MFFLLFLELSSASYKWSIAVQILLLDVYWNNIKSLISKNLDMIY